MGIVSMAGTGDVLPGGATQESSISFNHDRGDKHQCDTDESEQDRFREKENEYQQADNKSEDPPTHPPTGVGVDIGLPDILGKSGILLRERLFQLGKNSLFML
ncbi:MAG: hypothetical protein ABSE75_03400 [Acidimicrobiales bacterium]